jgi:adenosylcobinamide-GDP ribazoletransferase
MRAFFSAIAFLTVIPVPQRLKSARENGMFAGYPLAGLVIGMLLAAAAEAARWLFPPAVAAMALVALSLLLTGALHLDGLADCADAFYGHRDRSSVLRILKDPRVGTMGAAAIGLDLLLRGAAFYSLPAGLLVLSLPVAGLLSRSAVLLALRLLPYVREQSGIISARRPAGPGLTVLGAAAVLIAIVLLPIPGLTALAGLAALWRAAWRKIGGSTGDVLGATIEIAEVLFFAVLAAAAKAGSAAGLLYFLLHAARQAAR